MEKKLFSAMPQEVKEILRRFDEAAYEAYAVGGCVRDVLLGRTVNDWDLCSNARPEQVAELFSPCSVLPTGIEHGTVTLLYKGTAYEITMFRRESDYDGRKPHIVRPARTIEEDLARRDFTINAMAYSPKRGLVDLYGGREDLKKGLLRCVGTAEERFREDYLRILRGLRFSACYGLFIEQETARAMLHCRRGLRILSQERIWQELSRLLLGKWAGKVLLQFEPVLQGLWEGFSLSMIDGQKLDAMPPELCGRLALLLRHETEILESLRCPREEKERVRLLWQQAKSEKRGCAWLADFPPRYRRDDMSSALYLAGREGEIPSYEGLLDSGIPLDAAQLAVGGRDFLDMGLKGPEIGQTLKECLEAVWEKKVDNRREMLLAYIKSNKEKRK